MGPAEGAARAVGVAHSSGNGKTTRITLIKGNKRTVAKELDNKDNNASSASNLPTKPQSKPCSKGICRGKISSNFPDRYHVHYVFKPCFDTNMNKIGLGLLHGHLGAGQQRDWQS